LAREQETLFALSSPSGELLSEPNENSVVILLTTARILLAGDAKAKGENTAQSGSYTRP
jgi:beta-lactamase superfamily II metal-dependent hydrolase